MSNFNYFGTTLTNQNAIYNRIRSSSLSENACKHSVETPLFPDGYPRGNIETYKDIVLCTSCYVWVRKLVSTLREKHKPNLYNNNVLMWLDYFNRIMLEDRWGGEKLFDGVVMIFTFHKYCLGDQFKEEEARKKTWHAWRKREVVWGLVRKIEGKRQFGRHGRMI